jgi:hypothetical protein
LNNNNNKKAKSEKQKGTVDNKMIEWIVKKLKGREKRFNISLHKVWTKEVR